MKWPAARITESSKKNFGMYEKALPLIKQGVDLIHLEVGRPNFDTPLHIKEATKKALDDGIVHYGDFRGELKFRKALAKKLAASNNITVDDDEILVVNGLTHGSYAVFMAGLNPGDEVIVLEPYYPQHINKIELAGAKAVSVLLDKSRDFRIDTKAIEKAITPNTRMITLVNPANPTGKVFTREELEELAAIAIKHNLLVLSDEVYEQIVFDDSQHISIASLPGMMQRTITLFAFTKGYAMDGWRMGYIVASRDFMPALLKITMNDVAHVNVFIQEGGYAAITGSQDCVTEMVTDYKKRRDLVVRRLNAMPLIYCPAPEGSIYAFPDISQTGLSSADLANEILETCGVVVEASTFYGPNSEGNIRICFGAESYERIEEAMDRLEKFFADKA